MTKQQREYIEHLVERAAKSQEEFDKWLEKNTNERRYDDAMKGVGL